MYIIIFLIIVAIILVLKPDKRDGEVIAKEAIAKRSNKNQDDLINTVFSIAEKDVGGLWKVSFCSEGVTIYKKNGGSQYIHYSSLGYDKLGLHKQITYRSHIFNEFPYRLKTAAESRGYLYWTKIGYGCVEGSSYTSYDGGHSYTRDSHSGDYIEAANVCSKEYYRLNKPYPDPNAQPLKKL